MISDPRRPWKIAKNRAIFEPLAFTPSAPRPPILGEVVDSSPQGWGAEGFGLDECWLAWRVVNCRLILFMESLFPL